MTEMVIIQIFPLFLELYDLNSMEKYNYASNNFWARFNDISNLFLISDVNDYIYFLFKSNNKTRTTICHYGFFLFVYLLWGRAHASSSRDKNYLLQFLCDFFPWELTDKEKQQLCYNNFWKDTFALLQKKNWHSKCNRHFPILGKVEKFE